MATKRRKIGLNEAYNPLYTPPAKKRKYVPPTTTNPKTGKRTPITGLTKAGVPKAGWGATEKASRAASKRKRKR